MRLRLVGAQIPVTVDIESNLKTIHRAIDYAVAEKADLLLTPEGSVSGYTHEFDCGKATDALNSIIARAMDAGLALALGTCFVEPEDGRCYNQIRFYEKDGRYLGFHSKILTCGSMDDPPKGEINHYAVSPLRTFSLDGVRVGGLICNDLWANPGCTPIPDPHLTQELSRLGAQVVLHAVNGGRGDDEFSDVARHYHEANLRMRAKTGRIWIVTVDNCYPPGAPCSSPGGVLDPDGNWAIKVSNKGEQLFAYTIELD